MIFKLFRQSPVAHAAEDSYRFIVAQSRQERFYADWGVPDTVTGRFNMITLHMGLVLHRLRREPDAKTFSQALVERFFIDMDRSHRELGVTDLGVPRKIKKLGEVFYGTIEALDEALATDDPRRLEEVLMRNTYMGAGGPAVVAALAAYVRGEVERLDRTPTSVLLAGGLTEGAVA